MGQRQGHQRSGYHETSTSTTMHFLTNVVLQSPNGRARTMMHLNRILMIWNRCHKNNARPHLRKPMQSRANQKIISIQMKGHPMLQTVQQQCSRRQPAVREGLEGRLNTSATMWQGENWRTWHFTVMLWFQAAFQAIPQTPWRIPTGKQRWTESSNHWKKMVSGS